MSVLGIAGNSYNHYNKKQYAKNNTMNSGATEVKNTAPSNYNLHIGSEESEDGKALGMIGFPDGSSTSVFKGADYTADHPVFKVKTWDAEGNMTETEVDTSTVNPANASLQEMMAWNANRQLNGEEALVNELLQSAGRLHGDEVTSGYGDFLSNNDWISEMIDFMNMQYKLGNMEGYLQYKRASEMLQDISDGISNKERASNKENVNNYFSNAVNQFAEMVKDKIENNDTEPTYQIGGQSFTEKEWNKLIERIDKSVEEIKEEQEERIENQIQQLLTDNNERAFDSYGPNAPEEVKQAWMEAAEETGSNGAGMSASGKVTHISAMSAERAVRLIKGESDYADILGNSVQSAIDAAKKALYNLQNPLQPTSTKSMEAQNAIEKEKSFYNSFLSKLEALQ